MMMQNLGSFLVSVTDLREIYVTTKTNILEKAPLPLGIFYCSPHVYRFFQNFDSIMNETLIIL